jgi:ribosomal protein L29
MTARAVALDSLRALSGEELALHLREQRGQLFQVRLQQTIGQVENHRLIRAIRKEIAHTMTVQVEIRLAAERGEPAPAPRPAATATAGRRSRATTEAAPARSRRARTAAAAHDTAVAAPDDTAAAATPAAPDDTAAAATLAAVSPGAPVEEAISDVEVERIEPEDAHLAADPDDEDEK